MGIIAAIAILGLWAVVSSFCGSRKYWHILGALGILIISCFVLAVFQKELLSFAEARLAALGLSNGYAEVDAFDRSVSTYRYLHYMAFGYIGMLFAAISLIARRFPK